MTCNTKKQFPQKVFTVMNIKGQKTSGKIIIDLKGGWGAGDMGLKIRPTQFWFKDVESLKLLFKSNI